MLSLISDMQIFLYSIYLFIYFCSYAKSKKLSTTIKWEDGIQNAVYSFTPLIPLKESYAIQFEKGAV